MRNRLVTAFLAVILALTLLSGCGGTKQEAQPSPAQPGIQTSAAAPAGQTGQQQNQPEHSSQTPDVSNGSRNASQDQSTPDQPQGKLKVYFLDVGQADSILVQLPNGKNILVDAGNVPDGPFVVSYLQKVGVKGLDDLVNTHPHEDHLGGMLDVIKSFSVAKVYMPKVTTTTQAYAKTLQAIQAKGLKITTAKAGLTLYDEPGLSVKMLAPNSASYDDLNNYSAVIRIAFGKTSFLLTGDAQELSEEEMLRAGVDLKADVLKVGHHGSNTSTSPGFLKAVSPDNAVISLGAWNDYGHPAPQTLARLEAAGVKVYRTDTDGTLVFTSDGKKFLSASPPCGTGTAARPKPPRLHHPVPMPPSCM